jgi:hypothetical protein
MISGSAAGATGGVAADALYGGITELPPGILREGIPGFHYPAEDE